MLYLCTFFFTINFGLSENTNFVVGVLCTHNVRKYLGVDSRSFAGELKLHFDAKGS